MTTKIISFAQIQLMFNLPKLSEGPHSSPRTVTYKILPFEDGWSVLTKNANDTCSSPFGKLGKDVWTTEEVKIFFSSKDFTKYNKGKAYKSKDESSDINNKEEFLTLIG